MVEMMDLKNKLLVLSTIEETAYSLVQEIKETITGKKILMRKVDYRSLDFDNPDIIEKIVTVDAVTYYECDLTIRCKDSKGNFEYLSSNDDMEIIEDDDPRNI